MATYPCPKGHDSTEADYCSECGAKMQVVTPASDETISNAPPLRQSDQRLICPDCTTPHDLAVGNYCEICGYNFATGAHGELPVQQASFAVSSDSKSTALDDSADSLADAAAVTSVASRVAPQVELEGESNSSEPSDSPPKQDGLPVQTLPTSTTGWVAVISVDPALRNAYSPPAPNQPAVALPLEKPINLIGRTSEKRAIYPDVALDFDDAVSYRHGLLIVQSEDCLLFRDIGSSNGTRINGTEATVMADIPLHHHDELTLGHWTKIQICRSQ
ncbi:MAG: FHA domain-containing protein [Synechococcales cyanobacterium M58_A2018_015]|nr:FHA domain-containing protein [Synechococcales cyanobacterium M58_A2018_015]